jgi:hypothetical protein
MQKTKELYPQAIKGAEWREKDKEWRFPSGATLWMSYLDRDDDVFKYQGQSFTWIAFDELTQWPTPNAWNYLRSRLRSTGDIPLYMRACVDEGEVLTSEGWRDIRDIREGDLVQSLSSFGELILKPVTGYYEFEVSEPLVRIKKKNLYMSMTPDHRVVYKKYNSGINNLDRWDNLTTKAVSVVRTSSDYKSKGWSHPVICPEFLGLYIAEGSFNTNIRKSNYKVIITQNKIQNHEFVRKVMEKTGLKVCYSKNGDFQITNKKLGEYVSQFGKSHEKHFPRDFLNNATKEQLKLAFNAYALGDGHWQSPKSCSLHTTSSRLKDDLCEIAIKLGYKVQVAYQKLDNPNHNDRYVIYVSLRKDCTKVDKNPLGRNDQSFEMYNGKVYCLGVKDTENFIIRQKGFVWVSGNTSNPGGVGHGWVKKMFVDPAPAGKAFWAEDDNGTIMIYPSDHPTRAGQPLHQRKFIPAKVSDNPYLWKDGVYEANLLSLPEEQRRQLLEGDWDVATGAAFPEFRRSVHVIEPCFLDKSWRRFRSCDFGYSQRQASAVHWYAIHPATGQLIVYRELYGTGMTGAQLAMKIKELERGENISYGVLDSSVWAQRGQTGPSIAEEMKNWGVRWKPSDRTAGSRIAGRMRLHELLRMDELNKQPGIVFFNTCRKIIETLPVIPSDPNYTDDIDPDFVDDHAYDSIRYGIMSRPKHGVFEDLPTMSRHSVQFQTFDPKFGY